MKTHYLTTSAWGFEAGTSGIGRSRNDGGRTADAIFPDYVERLGVGCNAAFWTRTRGRMGGRTLGGATADSLGNGHQ